MDATVNKAGPSKQPGERILVVKIGGQIIDDPSALERFLGDFASLPGRKILVHGGGKIATEMGEKLGIRSRYVNGRRITDEATIGLVTMVYGGLINKRIVAALQAKGCNAIGLTGADANIIPAVRRPVKEVDYGFAGDIHPPLSVSTLDLLLRHGLALVFAPLTHDGSGQMLNTNADTIASALAVSLAKESRVRLVYCFEKKGVLRNVKDENDVVPLIDRDMFAQLLAAGALADGILPKLENALDAIRQGVSEVLIGRADDLLQNAGNDVAGTLIK